MNALAGFRDGGGWGPRHHRSSPVHVGIRRACPDRDGAASLSFQLRRARPTPPAGAAASPPPAPAPPSIPRRIGATAPCTDLTCLRSHITLGKIPGEDVASGCP